MTILFSGGQHSGRTNTSTQARRLPQWEEPWFLFFFVSRLLILFFSPPKFAFVFAFSFILLFTFVTGQLFEFFTPTSLLVSPSSLRSFFSPDTPWDFSVWFCKQQLHLEYPEVFSLLCFWHWGQVPRAHLPSIKLILLCPSLSEQPSAKQCFLTCRNCLTGIASKLVLDSQVEIIFEELAEQNGPSFPWHSESNMCYPLRQLFSNLS